MEDTFISFTEWQYNHAISVLAENAGILYVVRAGTSDLYKIGITRTEKASYRTKNLKSQNGEEVVPFYYKRVNDVFRVEREMHRMFEDTRVTGEWFRLDQECLDKAVKYLEKRLLVVVPSGPQSRPITSHASARQQSTISPLLVHFQYAISPSLVSPSARYWFATRLFSARFE